MNHLKTLLGTFISSAFCVLVEVGNRGEVNTSAYLSHWFQGSCYGLSLQISSVLLAAHKQQNHPPTPLMPARYFNRLLTDVVRFEAGNSDFRSPDFEWLYALMVYLFLGWKTCAHRLQQKKAVYVSPPFSVQLMLSWHSQCNTVGQDRSDPLSQR